MSISFATPCSQCHECLIDGEGHPIGGIFPSLIRMGLSTCEICVATVALPVLGAYTCCEDCPNELACDCVKEGCFGLLEAAVNFTSCAFFQSIKQGNVNCCGLGAPYQQIMG